MEDGNMKTDKSTRLAAVLMGCAIALLAVVTVCGVCSFSTAQTSEIVNQYGDTVKIWGAGVYAHDSFFKATTFIGSDATILIFILPLAIYDLVKMIREQTAERYIRSFGVLCLLLYYAASVAFGVTYNCLHLVYIALVGLCFYGAGLLFVKLHGAGARQEAGCEYPVSKGMQVFLLAAGVALFVAWLPDIASSMIRGTSLELIEVYTTEITYVLDMGIISPLMIVTFCLIRRRSFIGYVLFRMILQVCIGVGIMLPIQSLVQVLAGMSIPIPALITKVLVFVMLAAAAGLFEHRLRRETRYIGEIA